MITYAGQLISKDTPTHILGSWTRTEAREQKWGKDERKVTLAGDIAQMTNDYIRSMPIGWNVDNTQDELHAKTIAYITTQVKPKLKSYGFLILGTTIGTFLFWNILAAIIQWSVERILNLYYRE